jgi:hypothetical protein
MPVGRRLQPAAHRIAGLHDKVPFRIVGDVDMPRLQSLRILRRNDIRGSIARRGADHAIHETGANVLHHKRRWTVGAERPSAPFPARSRRLWTHRER